MEKEIIEGNSLIRVFENPLMGIKDGWVIEASTGERLYPVASLNYHKDWNSLMPVVEKIEGLGYSVFIQNDCCWIKAAKPRIKLPPITHLKDSKIESTWQAVVEFIKYFNNQKL
jgi:hypothetical protein